MYASDRRGNRLAAYLFTHTPGVRMHHLCLQCSDDIAAQFLDLDHCGVHYRRADLVGKEWTHRLEADGPPDPRVRSLADEVVTRRPTLATAEIVVVVPAHDRTLLSFGERLAATVATRRGLVEIRVEKSARVPTPGQESWFQ